jgi:hypothetical protein
VLGGELGAELGHFGNKAGNHTGHGTRSLWSRRPLGPALGLVH